MTIDLEVTGDVLTVRLEGVFDSSNSTALAERLSRKAHALQFESVIIDLARCERLGTLAIGGLVGFRLDPVLADKGFGIVGASCDVWQELRALCMERLFVIEPFA